MGERGDFLIAHHKARTPQAATDDRHQIARAQAPTLEPRRQSHKITRAKGVLEFGERAKRETEPEVATPETRLNFTTMQIGHGPPQIAVKVSAPADSSASSKVTSPACSPR